MLRIRWPCLALYAAILWLICLQADGAQAKPILEGRDNPQKPKFVFRVDSRSPEEIRAVRGFLGRATENGNLGRDSAYSIDVHNEFIWRTDPTVYVSTTAEFGVAARFAQPGDYIYVVRARSNVMSVNIALGSSSRYPWQEEWVAMGGIPNTDIVSSWRVPEEDIYPGRDEEEDDDEDELEDKIRDKVDDLNAEYKNKYKAQFTRNLDYKGDEEAPGVTEPSAIDAQTMRSFSGLAVNGQAATGLGERAWQFMDSHGAEVGWQRGQQFPLWAPPGVNSQPSTSGQGQGACGVRAAHALLPLLRNVNPDDQTRNLAAAKAEADKNLCGAADQGCKDKLASLLQTRFPQRDPAKVEETARELEAICARSLGEPPAERHSPDAVAGPSGLCRGHAAKALKPVRAKGQGQKRPLQEVVGDVKQAICTQQPLPPKKANTAERCEHSVQDLLSVFNDVGGDIGNYLMNPAEIDKDLCFEPGTFEYLSTFPWESAHEAPPTAGSPPEHGQQLGQSAWPQLVQQVQQQFRIAEQQLRQYLDAGIQSLQRDHRDVYDLLVQSFPPLVEILQQLAREGIRFSSCLPDKPASRQRLKARADQAQNDLCNKLLGAIGQSGSGGSRPDQPPSTPPSSDQKNPQDAKDNTTPSEGDVNLGLALGLPAGAIGVGGLAAFAASPTGQALLASIAASLGVSSELGSAEAVASAFGRATSSLTRVTRQAVQRVIQRVSRLGHRVANPLLRQFTSRALRFTTERAAERIPLLSFSG